MCRRNAPLTPTGRLRLARYVVDDGRPLRRAAERFQASRTTAARWPDRYRQLGTAGMHARFSRPHHHPAPRPGRRGATGRTPAARAPHRTCAAGGRCRCRILHRLPHPAPPRPACACRAGPGHRQLRRRRRYERARPGELVHIDVKKPGRIPDGGGHKVLGRQAGRANRKPSMAGYVCLPCPPAPRPGSPTRASALTGPGPGGRRPTARPNVPTAPARGTGLPAALHLKDRTAGSGS